MMYAMWTKSEAEAAKLQAAGWRPSRMHEVACNHNEFAMLLVLEGDNPSPQFTKAAKAE